MKKFLGFLVGAAAVMAAAVYFNNKKKQNTVLVSQEFDEGSPANDEEQPTAEQE
ncbi:MAG: hypothetical protein IJN61_02255 [Clostridia bacterium]|nr:hypothetical protein [Clostridia bacterium]MBQ7037923.1 hypothetical protein [Clostridia bacterium]